MPERILIKSHIKGYTKRDGTFVAAHDDKRQAATENARMLSIFQSLGRRAQQGGAARNPRHHGPFMDYARDSSYAVPGKPEYKQADDAWIAGYDQSAATANGGKAPHGMIDMDEAAYMIAHAGGSLTEIKADRIHFTFNGRPQSVGTTKGENGRRYVSKHDFNQAVHGIDPYDLRRMRQF